MKRYNNRKLKFMTFLMALFYISVSSVFVSCDDDDNDSLSDVVLLSYGPSPALRGSDLTFIGRNLDKVTSVVLPDEIEITDIEVISSDKIKVTIPQDAAEGYVKLYHPEGELVTKSLLGYIEPIEIEEVSPNPIKAGQTLSITGDYLNLIHYVIFADRDTVASEDFTSWERKKIELVLPKEAKTGTITLSDTSAIPIEIEVEDILEVVLPSVAEVVEITGKKPGDEIAVEGSDLDLVESIVLANGESVEFALDENVISFTLPEGTTDGEVEMIAYSEVSVPLANVTMAVPTELSASPATGLRGGVEITIAGTDMDLVTTVMFPGTSEAVTPSSISAGQVKVTMPEAAISGDLVLNTASGKSVSVAIETLKPEVTEFNPNPVTGGSELTITGTKLDLVSSIIFSGDVSVDVSATFETQILVTLPLEAESGDVTLVMANGETVVAGSITVDPYTFCTVSEFDSETTTVGDLLKCTVINGSNLTDVKLNDSSTEFILNGNILFVNVGLSTGIQKLTLVSNDGTEIDYDVEIIGAGLVETILYDIPLEIVQWGGATLPYTVDVPLPANAKIRIRVAQANSELQVMDGYWGMGPNWLINDDAEKNVLHFSQEELSAGYVDVDFSGFHDENGDAWWDGKIMFNADGVIVSSVSLVVDYSAPTSIWTGTFDIGSWQGMQDLAWGGFDWSTVKAGQTLYFTFTMNAGNEWGCLSLRHGNNWGNLPTASSAQIDFGSTDTEGTYTLTQADIDDLIANNGLVITGANVTLTNVAIK